MRETPPSIERKMQELYEKLSPEERWKMGWSMFQSSQQLIKDSILRKNPNITPKQLKKELFLVYYGDDYNEEQKKAILDYIDSKIK